MTHFLQAFFILLTQSTGAFEATVLTINFGTIP